jgi:hypothetical protein
MSDDRVVDWIKLAQCTGYRMHGNEHFSFIKVVEFVDQLRKCQSQRRLELYWAGVGTALFFSDS